MYLILAEHAHGAKISEPEDVCNVSQAIPSPRIGLEVREDTQQDGLLHSALVFFCRLCLENRSNNG